MKTLLIVFAVTGLMSAFAARADDSVTVNDMSQLSWQLDTNSGKVWLWNLDHFDPSFLPCCYKYYIDLATASGKAQWAAILAHGATGARLVFYVTNKTQAGPITFLMN